MSPLQGSVEDQNAREYGKVHPRRTSYIEGLRGLAYAGGKTGLSPLGPPSHLDLKQDLLSTCIECAVYMVFLILIRSCGHYLVLDRAYHKLYGQEQRSRQVAVNEV